MGRFIGLLLAFILVVPLIRMVLGMLARMFTNFAGKPSSAGPSGPARVPAGGTLRKDPRMWHFCERICRENALQRGKTHHFCSDACLKKFLEAPRQS
ncbi:MAG: hypothetical protein IPP47_14450 [Bryobacterales bacterium]|nr:hypothetical protein [Bryobacterales bacterium]